MIDVAITTTPVGIFGCACTPFPRFSSWLVQETRQTAGNISPPTLCAPCWHKANAFLASPRYVEALQAKPGSLVIMDRNGRPKKINKAGRLPGRKMRVRSAPQPKTPQTLSRPNSRIMGLFSRLNCWPKAHPRRDSAMPICVLAVAVTTHELKKKA